MLDGVQCLPMAADQHSQLLAGETDEQTVLAPVLHLGYRFGTHTLQQAFQEGLRLLRGGFGILIAHPDPGRHSADAQEAGLGPLQDLHRDLFPALAQLLQGGGDGQFLRLSGGFY